MNLSLSSLFCCWGARKPNRSQTPPPDYDASERDALLGTGSRERTGEGSRAQANPQAGDANYRKWLSRQQRIWWQANTSQDFESWLEERYRPNLDDQAWDDYQARTRIRQAQTAYYTRSRTGMRLNRVG